MIVPGANILSIALSAIGSQSMSYYQSLSRLTNDIGQWVTTYAPPIMLYGSIQPVPRKIYAQYGLDFQKSYFTIYVSKNIIDLQRDISADQIILGSDTYQCESSDDWFTSDQWDRILCVLITGQAG